MLLNQLLPAVTKDLNDPLIHYKEYFLANRPDGPQKLGMEMFPKLIQVGCLSCYLVNAFFFLSTLVDSVGKDMSLPLIRLC